MKFMGVVFRLVLTVQCVMLVTESAAAQPESCSACNCQVNNVDVLQNLVELLINRSLDNRLPAIQAQLNANLNERIVDSQRDIPGNYKLHANHVGKINANAIARSELFVVFTAASI